MNKNIFITLFFALFLNALNIKAQSIEKSIINNFFTLYVEKTPEEAIKYIYSSNKWLKIENEESFLKLTSQLKGMTDLCGDYCGYELLVEKDMGSSYKLVNYIVKYERQPIRFSFILYKPLDKWQIQNFQFDDLLSNDLEDAGKITWLLEN